MIKASFNTYSSYVTDSLYQWDTGQELRIEGLHIGTNPEVHFTNSAMGKSIVRQAELDNGVVVVNIPNSILQYPLDIKAYIGVYNDSSFNVIETVVIPVIPQEKPENYAFESLEDELYSFNALENKITNSKTELKKYVNNNTGKLNSRIDNIIAHNNDTEGNTELIDIRSDCDGVVHDTAGEAVRTQISNLNLLSIGSHITFENGGITSNGKIFEDENDRTDRLRSTTAISNCVQINYAFFGTPWAAIALYFVEYDANGNFIKNDSRAVGGDFRTFIPDENTKYIRFVVAVLKGDLDSVSGLKLKIYTNTAATEHDRVIDNFKIKSLQSDIENLSSDTDSKFSVADINKPYQIGSLNQIARLGWNVYSKNTPPEQSIDSYKLAYDNNCRIMLCDIRVTSDGVLVCRHDEDLGAALGTNTVRHTDGTELSESEKALKINESTISQLDEFDFGLYKGEQYAGLKILRLEDFLKWCARINCIPMLEIKVTLTEDQVNQMAMLCGHYGLSDRTIIADGYDQTDTTLQAWIDAMPNAIMCLRGASANWNKQYSNALRCRQANMHTVLSVTNPSATFGSASLENERLQLIARNQIDLCYSEIQSTNDLKTFSDEGWLSIFRYVASSYVHVLEWTYNNT